MGNGIAVAIKTFQFNRMGTSFHETINRTHGVGQRFSKGQKRHVTDDKFIFYATGYTFDVPAHHFNICRNGRAMTVHDHRSAVTHEDHIHIRFLHDTCRGIVITGQHDNFLSTGFESLEIKHVHDIFLNCA